MPSSGPDLTHDTSLDAFLGGKVHLRQPKRGPRSGLDAVFVAAACPAIDGDVLDAGAGVGAISFCLAARLPGIRVTGVEIDPGLAALFRLNAGTNGMVDHCRVIEADLTAPLASLKSLNLHENTFDHVVSNPPFFTEGKVRPSETSSVRRAHVAPEAGLEGWLRFMTAVAKPGATLTLIHHADALTALLNGLSGRFGGLTVFPLFPREGSAAIRVVVTGIKGSRAPVSLLRGMVLHQPDGTFTTEAAAILREGAALSLPRQ